MVNKYLTYFRDKIVGLKLQNEKLSAPKWKWKILSGGILIIIVWQLLFAFTSTEHLSRYGRQDASGFTHKFAKHFIYYYHYLDLFPVTTTYKPLEYSTSGAESTLKVHGDSLLMEWGHWSRLGESTRILLYLPDIAISGSPENPSIIPFNTLLFILVLVAVFIAFWSLRMPLLGFLIVLFFGSSPFLLYEIYSNENIFGLMITVTLLIMAINLRLFKVPPSSRWIWALPIVSGLIIATAMNIRSETTVITGCCLFIYALIPGWKHIKRVLMCALLLVIVYLGNYGWGSYFDMKFNEAYQVVQKAGGNPYDGPRSSTHNFWHPLYCGLGDFDTKFGYQWEDRSAYNYALPILKEKYNLNLKWSNDLMLDEYYDKDKKYYRKLELYPEYEEVIKEKVLHDIKNEPLWYFHIIRKRIYYIFSKTSPVWLSLGTLHLALPINGVLLIPFILLLLYQKRWFEVKLLLFSLPLAATSLLIFAKMNTTYNSGFHLFLSAFILAWLIEWIINRLKKRNRTPLAQ